MFFNIRIFRIKELFVHIIQSVFRRTNVHYFIIVNEKKQQHSATMLRYLMNVL
jgi:hypothetical protein